MSALKMLKMNEVLGERHRTIAVCHAKALLIPLEGKGSD
jgi:hypothetical protein